ncbi:MAG TPA: sugar phosphate isomerase/epimerase [Puia sp.]|nr:sugar phosphate isomerase/epimerase [Puia sp.]
MKSLPRREFLKMSGAAALAASLPRIVPSWPRIVTPMPRIAVQLYTVRQEFEKDIPGTLHKLATMGIRYVETAFWPKNVAVRQAARYIRDAGLSVCSSHTDIPVGDHKAAVSEIAEAFGTRRVIWHGWPEDKRYSNVDGTKQLIDLYNQAGEWATTNGLEFGLHNHWWEFRNRVGDRLVYEWLLDGVHKNIFFEIDTYWVKVAGQDPAAIIAKYGDRAKFLHMKDGPAVYNEALARDKPDPMVALGKGTQNVPAIAAAAKDHIEWMVIEMDVVAGDVFAAIRESVNYLVSNRFARL